MSGEQIIGKKFITAGDAYDGVLTKSNSRRGGLEEYSYPNAFEAARNNKSYNAPVHNTNFKETYIRFSPEEGAYPYNAAYSTSYPDANSNSVLETFNGGYKGIGEAHGTFVEIPVSYSKTIMSNGTIVSDYTYSDLGEDGKFKKLTYTDTQGVQWEATDTDGDGIVGKHEVKQVDKKPLNFEG